MLNTPFVVKKFFVRVIVSSASRPSLVLFKSVSSPRALLIDGLTPSVLYIEIAFSMQGCTAYVWSLCSLRQDDVACYALDVEYFDESAGGGHHVPVIVKCVLRW